VTQTPKPTVKVTQTSKPTVKVTQTPKPAIKESSVSSAAQHKEIPWFVFMIILAVIYVAN